MWSHQVDAETSAPDLKTSWLRSRSTHGGSQVKRKKAPSNLQRPSGQQKHSGGSSPPVQAGTNIPTRHFGLPPIQPRRQLSGFSPKAGRRRSPSATQQLVGSRTRQARAPAGPPL